MMNYYGYDMMGGWGIFMMIILVILIVIIVYAVMKLVQGGNNSATYFKAVEMRHLKSLISVMQKEKYRTKNTNKRRKY